MVRYQTRTRLFRVNSRYKQEGGTNYSFSYLFNSRYIDRVLSVTLQSASVMRMFGNFYIGRNTTLDYLVGAVPFTFNIPAGQYNAEQLASILDTCPDWICTYDTVTQRFVFEYDSIDDVTILATSSCAYELGLTANIVLIPASVISLQNAPNLSGPNLIYLQSQLLAQSSHCIDVEQLGFYIPLVCPIPCNSTPAGYSIQYEQKERNVGRVEFDDVMSLRKMDFQLTDQNGFLLTGLPSNCELDLVFVFEYASD